MSKALIVLSGGQDSTTCLFWAKQKFEELHAITFDYGQRHKLELVSAAKVAELAGVKTHEIIELGPVLKGCSPLTDPAQELEQYTDFESMDATIGERVELTFVPMRNALFLTIAVNRAVCLECEDIVVGVCQADNANYPDCRQSFLDSLRGMALQALGREHGEATMKPDGSRFQDIQIHAPLMDMSKAQSINLALSIPGAYPALAWTHTAYDGGYPPLGKDHASVLRAWGFEQAGVPDPLVLRAHKEGLMELPETENYGPVV